MRVCGHCGQPLNGAATVPDATGDNYIWLCHASAGPDCYRLVTVYGHPMPHPDCPVTAPAQ